MSAARKLQARVGPKYPHVVVLFGATGDLSRRKLLPGLFHLATTGFIPGCRIVGVSLDDMTPDAFREFGPPGLTDFSSRRFTDEAWNTFAAHLNYVPLSAGPGELKSAVEAAEQSFVGAEWRRLDNLGRRP